MKVTYEQVRTLTDQNLVTLRAEALTKSKTAATYEQRSHWSKFILYTDAEIARRRQASSSQAPGTARLSRREPDPGMDLAKRLDDVRESLYGDQSRRRAKQTANKVRKNLREGR